MTDIKKHSDYDREMARLILDPSLQAANTIQHVMGVSGNRGALIDELENQIEALESGDVTTIKQNLYSQILTLNMLFHDLCVSAKHGGHYTNGYSQHFLSVALKCQRQAMQSIALLSAYLPPPCIEAKASEHNSGNELSAMEKSDG